MRSGITTSLFDNETQGLSRRRPTRGSRARGLQDTNGVIDHEGQAWAASTRCICPASEPSSTVQNAPKATARFFYTVLGTLCKMLLILNTACARSDRR